MCGIAGVLSGDAAPELAIAAGAMSRRLAHRGPDGCAQWRSPSGLAVLANTRLAVFDVSAAASQPMSDGTGRFTITYNGAIYNFRALRAQLEGLGVRFRTHSDTEVILQAYARYGAACVDRLRGMFAFVIWDEHERRAFIARDALGIKPLYYAAAGGRLVFASELRALAASNLVSRAIDTTALYRYFRRGSVAEPRTLLQDVDMLPAGATATWRGGRLTVQTPVHGWGSDAASASGRHADDARAALLDSVSHHLAADVPVGIFLSGGVDSAAIAALSVAAGRRDVRAFSLAFSGAAGDEGAAAARTAAHFGLSHQVLEVDAAHAKREFRQFAAAIDQPSIDGLNTFVAAKFARDHGMTVMLSGLGADELFGGYNSFWRVPAMARWHRLSAAAGPVAGWAGALLQRLPGNPRARRVGDLLQQPPSLGAAYDTFRGIFTRAESRRLVHRFTGADAAAAIDRETTPAGLRPADAVSVMELTEYVRNQLLRDGDVMSMASAIELRTPFLDREVMAALWKMPSGVRLQRGKKLLVDAVPEIPAFTVTSPKRVFQFPFEEWSRGEWRDVFAPADALSPVPTETWYRKWCVLAAEQSMKNLNEAGGA